jgi:hypothetical protein
MSDTLFDDESEFALSQFDLESFLRQEEQLGNLPYPRSIHIDDTEDFSLRKKQNDDRFQRPASTDDVERTRIMSFPASTVKNTNWGINTYDSWGRWRNSYVQKPSLTSTTNLDSQKSTSAAVSSDVSGGTREYCSLECCPCF